MTDRANSLTTLARVAFCCLLLSIPLGAFAPSRADAQRRRARPAAPPARMDFAHARREHQMACDKCHQLSTPGWKEARTGDAAFPDVTRQPEHASCLNCHRKQFFARERPQPRICSVCHVAVTPRDQARVPFPNPPEAFDRTERARDFVSDFRVGFPHDKHLEVVGALVAPGHTTTAGGVRFVTASYRPAPRRAAEDSDPKSCMVCHDDKRAFGGDDFKDCTRCHRGEAWRF